MTLKRTESLSFDTLLAQHPAALDTGSHCLYAEAADHAQQHGEDRETLGSNHTCVLTFKTVAFRWEVLI